MTTQAPEIDDTALLRIAVRNLGKLSTALNDLTTLLEQTVTDVTIHVEYDDRIARALESIADTLARLERS